MQGRAGADDLAQTTISPYPLLLLNGVKRQSCRPHPLHNPPTTQHQHPNHGRSMQRMQTRDTRAPASLPLPYIPQPRTAAPAATPTHPGPHPPPPITSYDAVPCKGHVARVQSVHTTLTPRTPALTQYTPRPSPASTPPATRPA